LTTWYQEISAGENPAQGTYAPGIINQIAHFRSPYYQDSLISTDVAAGTETPVFDIQGWTDDLFPQVAGASMNQKVRAANARWRSTSPTAAVAAASSCRERPPPTAR